MTVQKLISFYDLMLNIDK